MDKTPVEQRKRAAIYTRISEDKTGRRAGVTRQLEDCRALAKRLKWKVVDTYDDNDISAYNGRTRPGFEALLAAIRAGHVEAVVCWHPDRLYRRLKDLERLVEITERGVQIASVNAGDIDLSTSAGRMVARILGSVAQQESEHHAERRARACLQKAEAGKWETANRPFGYTMRKGMPKEPEAQALRDAVREVLEGKSIQAVAREWNAAGLTTTRGVAWRSPRVRRVLLNPRYAGLKVYRGAVVERTTKTGERLPVTGKWTALIDVATHERLVRLLTDKDRITTTTSWERKFPGAGVYRCGLCTERTPPGTMKSHQSGGPNQRRTYVCRTSGHVSRNAANLDAYVENAILERLSRPNVRLVIARQQGSDVAELQDERAGYVAKYDELSTLLIDGTLDGPAVRRNAESLKARIAAVDRTLAAATRTSPTARLIASGEDLRARWEQMDATLRSQVIDELAVVTVLPAKRGRGFDADYVQIAWKVDEQ